MLLLMIVIVVIVIVIACKLAGVGGKAASIPIPTLQVNLAHPTSVGMDHIACLMQFGVLMRHRPEGATHSAHEGAVPKKGATPVVGCWHEAAEAPAVRCWPTQAL